MIVTANMQLRARLNKPEYLFQPHQIVKRLMRRSEEPDALIETMLPWGIAIRSRPADLIGGSISRMGLYDLCVTETLWRLLDPGELAVDAGANIGYMTGVMARRIGSAGTVMSFEPHPEIYGELTSNIELFRSSSNIATIRAFRTALSAIAGTEFLLETDEFAHNRGGASLLDPTSRRVAKSFAVATRRLDDVTDPRVPIGVMKIDVEGHELGVLDGCEERLSRNAIRDIVFEEHRVPPTPVTRRLENHGYEVFRLAKGLLGPIVAPTRKRINDPFDTPNYLATVDTHRALERLRPRSWRVLRN